jgi:hypothetical protein
VSSPRDATDQASDQARFAAREFVAKFAREMGAELSAVVMDRMLFAYEMGYLRGCGEGMRAMSAFHDELRKKADDEPK